MPPQNASGSNGEVKPARRSPGPWELPPPKDDRPPVFKARKQARTPIINNWRGLLVVVLLLFVAPPVVGWVVQVVMSLLRSGS